MPASSDTGTRQRATVMARLELPFRETSAACSSRGLRTRRSIRVRKMHSALAAPMNRGALPSRDLASRFLVRVQKLPKRHFQRSDVLASGVECRRNPGEQFHDDEPQQLQPKRGLSEPQRHMAHAAPLGDARNQFYIGVGLSSPLQYPPKTPAGAVPRHWGPNPRMPADDKQPHHLWLPAYRCFKSVGATPLTSSGGNRSRGALRVLAPAEIKPSHLFIAGQELPDLGSKRRGDSRRTSADHGVSIGRLVYLRGKTSGSPGEGEGGAVSILGLSCGVLSDRRGVLMNPRGGLFSVEERSGPGIAYRLPLRVFAGSFALRAHLPLLSCHIII